jgi:hypothetical protein
MMRPESVAKKPGRRVAWGWRWVLGLVAGTAVVVIVVLSIGKSPDFGLNRVVSFHAPNAPVIQLAMLVTVGGTRRTDMNETATLQGTWKESPVQLFFSASQLEAWEKNWPNGDGRSAAKIIYDRAAGEVRVSGRSGGKFFQRTFLLEKDDLALTLQHVREFIREQTKT